LWQTVPGGFVKSYFHIDSDSIKEGMVSTGGGGGELLLCFFLLVFDLRHKDELPGLIFGDRQGCGDRTRCDLRAAESHWRAGYRRHLFLFDFVCFCFQNIFEQFT